MGQPREDELFHAVWAMLGFKACIESQAAQRFWAVYKFRLDDEGFNTGVDNGSIEMVHGPAQDPMWSSALPLTYLAI